MSEYELDTSFATMTCKGLLGRKGQSGGPLTACKRRCAWLSRLACTWRTTKSYYMRTVRNKDGAGEGCVLRADYADPAQEQ